MSRSFSRRRGSYTPPQKDGKRSGYESRLSAAILREDPEATYESFRIPYIKKPATYTPDYFLSNGVIIEAKGWFTSEDRTKHLLVQKQHPPLDIRFVFENAHAMATEKLTCAEWAEKHGFKWAHKSVPRGWYLEPAGQSLLYLQELMAN